MATERDFVDPNYQKVIEQVGALHPEWDQYQSWKTTSGQPTAGAAPTTATPGAPTATNVQDQAKAASTYSATPGSAPAPNTTNQGTQDVVRNTYLQQATQPTNVDRNNPNVRPQADAYAAAQDRARRQYESESAERLSAQGLGSSGAMQNERRLAMERAAQNTGSFEAQLVGNELKALRTEKQMALDQLLKAGQIDQANALQRELAKIDAQLKQAGIDVQSSLGGREIDVKDKLGTGGLNVDMMRLLMQQQQFGDQLGFNIADREAYWNNAALQNLF